MNHNMRSAYRPIYCFSVNLRPLKTFFTAQHEHVISWRCISTYRPNRNISLPFHKNLVYVNEISQRVEQMCTQKLNHGKKICWKCKKLTGHPTFFCDSCNALQPIDKNLDLFKIIGVKCSYNIDSSELSKKYRNLQALLHPDKFSSKSKIARSILLWTLKVLLEACLGQSINLQEEQELSEELSSFINKAYAILSDPLERGLYMLSQHGIFIDEDSKQIAKEFLMEMMERNEEIENETQPEKLKQCFTSIRQEIEFHIKKVTDAFERNDIEEAKELLIKMKYFYSIASKIKDIKQKLDIPD